MKDIINIIMCIGIIAFIISSCAAHDAEENVYINFTSPTRSGFNTVVIGDIKILNRNTFKVSDVKFACDGYSKTGSKIDSNTRTIYEYIYPDKSIVINHFNIGFVHSEVVDFKCKVLKVKTYEEQKNIQKSWNVCNMYSGNKDHYDQCVLGKIIQ